DNRDHFRRPSERYHVYAMEELRDFKWVNGQWVERDKSIRPREQELLNDDYGQIKTKSIKLRLHLDQEHTRYTSAVEGGAPVCRPDRWTGGTPAGRPHRQLRRVLQGTPLPSRAFPGGRPARARRQADARVREGRRVGERQQHRRPGDHGLQVFLAVPPEDLCP